MPILIATGSEVLRIEEGGEAILSSSGLHDHLPTCLAGDPLVPERVWCGTRRGGIFRSDDGGASWVASGLEDQNITAVMADPVERGGVWAGTEPSSVWHSADGGGRWERTRRLEVLPSSSEWAFPPRPDTHHVRWLAAHPTRVGRIWAAIEAGALVCTDDGGRRWRDRVEGGPWDTHELALHPDRPEVLRVAAGDGYFESHDAGLSWRRPRAGLEIGYMRSIAIDPGDPDIVVISGASTARKAYGAGRSDGRVYRREGGGEWERVLQGWPDPPDTIAPLLRPGQVSGEFWAADERGIHHSDDGGVSWSEVASYPEPPHNLRGLEVVRWEV